MQEAAEPDFSLAVRKLDDAVRKALEVPGWHLWDSRRDPELRRAYRRLRRATHEASRLQYTPRSQDDSSPCLEGESEAHFARLLSLSLDHLRSIDALDEDVDALEDVLLERGDRKYIYSRICYELYLAGSSKRGRQTTKLTHRDLLPDDENFRKWSSKGSGLPAAELDAARLLLGVIARGRTRAASHQRTRARIRQYYLLQYLAPILVALVVGLGVATVFLIDPGQHRAWEIVLLAAMAGAIGSALASLYQVRDRLLKIDELRAFWPAMLVQPLLGAAAGLVLLLILESALLGLVQLDAESPVPWATIGILGFVAGYSEAWFLSLVARLADVAEPTGPTSRGRTCEREDGEDRPGATSAR
jgi:hypothetical protein